MSGRIDIEAREAQLALHGIEEAPRPAAPARLDDGPRDPDALLAQLGHSGFRPGQREAVEAALAGRDSVIVMPTGGGKSLCYQLPGLATSDLTIVVSPLIALMADQWQRLAAGGHPAVMLASGLPAETTAESVRQIRSGEARLVYCSPERFASRGFIELLASRRVDLFAIDEAHCLSEWGHDFRPDYLRLPKAIARLGRPTVMACTATATKDVAAEIVRRVGLRRPLAIRSGFDRPNISFDVVALEGAGTKQRKLGLLEVGLRDPANRPAIVYCGTRRDTDEVADLLGEAGFDPVAYHAGLEPDERASAQHRFMGGEVDVVVATNAFGMGVDKADVRSVWHWAIPTSVEAYYQEAGRAGRDGAPARAVLLAAKADLSRLVHFNERRKVDPADVARFLGALRRRAEDGRSLTIEAPAGDGERIRLAIAERAGACAVEPAGGGRMEIRLAGSLDRERAEHECGIAANRGWRGYRAVKAFAFGEACRRRMLLSHFGDPSPVRPLGRCCDVCEADAWLPDPQSIAVRPRRPARGGGKRAASRSSAPELSPADAALFESLREWRRQAAAGKPAYTVAHDATLRAIAASRPTGLDALSGLRGIGPSFIARHGAEVLRRVADAA